MTYLTKRCFDPPAFPRDASEVVEAFSSWVAECHADDAMSDLSLDSSNWESTNYDYREMKT